MKKGSHMTVSYWGLPWDQRDLEGWFLVTCHHRMLRNKAGQFVRHLHVIMARDKHSIEVLEESDTHAWRKVIKRAQVLNKDR